MEQLQQKNKLSSQRRDPRVLFILLLVLFSMIIVSGAASAADGSNKQTSANKQTSQQACRADYEKFCQHTAGNRAMVAHCMKQHETSLSVACRNAISQARERYLDLVRACQQDLEQQCANIKTANGQVIRCLQRHKSSISSPCKAALQQADVL